MTVRLFAETDPDVDAESETGTTHPYERVGLQGETCGVSYERALV